PLTARDAAREFRALALRTGMLQRERVNIPAPPIEQQMNQERLRAASDILQHRMINFIGFSEEANEVVVYTGTRITKAEALLLPANIAGIPIVYVKGGAAHVGSVPPTPMGIDSYTLHN